MASFTPSKKTASDFNNNTKYVDYDPVLGITGDSPQADTINNLVESTLFTQGIAVNAPNIDNADKTGTPNVSIEILSDGTARLKFENLKGDTGEPGAAGKDGKNSILCILNERTDKNETSFERGVSNFYPYPPDMNEIFALSRNGYFYECIKQNNTTYKCILIANFNGNGIENINADYQIGITNTNPPTGEWLKDIPEANKGEYLWTRITILYSNTQSFEYYVVNNNSYAISKTSELTNDGNGISPFTTEVALQAETTRAQGAEQVNSKAISAEITRAEGVESGLGTRITVIENNYIPKAQRGASGGLATLDSTGKVPTSQLPSYVSDVFEYDKEISFPIPGEENKIYVAKDTNKTYRWSGTAYTEISPSLALGETSATAYAGNKGKANADNISALQTRMAAVESKNITQDTAISAAQTTANNAMPKSGGAFTGRVSWNETSLPAQSTAPYFVTIEAFASGGRTYYTSKANVKSELGITSLETSVASKYTKPSGGIPASDLAGNIPTSKITGLATVATSGSYTDLTDIPATPNISITNNGSGNAVTGITANGHTLTVTKSTTFATTATATQSANGLMSATDKKNHDSMWAIWSSDGTDDTLVNKVQEVLSAFASFKEGDTIIGLLANKADKSEIPDVPDTLPPSGAAGGDLSGNYPNPTIGNGKVTKEKLESSVQASLNKANNAVQKSTPNNYAIDYIDVKATDTDETVTARYCSDGVLYGEMFNGVFDSPAKFNYPADKKLTEDTFAMLSDLEPCLDPRTRFLAAHPVGSWYFTDEEFSPAESYGGTWEELPFGTYLTAAGEDGVVGVVLGSDTHTHKAGDLYACFLAQNSDRMSARIVAKQSWQANTTADYSQWRPVSNWNYSNATDIGGTTASASNLPPSLTTHIWKRVG